MPGEVRWYREGMPLRPQRTEGLFVEREGAMALSKRYNPLLVEPRLQAFWEEAGVYRFASGSRGPVYSIDTPPATVSGHLHLGHVYSYSQTDFMARFWRMNGRDVFYPMGYDDNGLPTARFVARRLGISLADISYDVLADKCLQAGAEMQQEYETLWRRLALSVDWHHTYRTIEPRSQRLSQHSFLDLYRRGLAYRRKAPTIWCPECGTAIAQAELNDLDRDTMFYTVAFQGQDSTVLPIATTRPELLPACVAVFVHPDDARFLQLVDQRFEVPLFHQTVPVLRDSRVDPGKGTGAVMCCTFGDVTDVEWWHSYSLPLVEAIAPDGRLTEIAGEWAGLAVAEARPRIVEALRAGNRLLDQKPSVQSVRVHERCDTPAEYIVTQQWFISVLHFKDALLEAGEQIVWHPPHMGARYRQWVENLGWDWCISRQRTFGVPFPLWYCRACGIIVLAHEDQLPVDPRHSEPGRPCSCGAASFIPEEDVMDTWATSSLTPQIAGHWSPAGPASDGELYAQVFPMSLRSQAHDIIRTWAFYTIVKSLHHFGVLPWREVAISGWGIAGEGMGKISKSRGGGPISPLEAIEHYSSDAVRYWAASTGLGKDAVISEDKMQVGARLVTKLWNVARFAQPFLLEPTTPAQDPLPRPIPPALSPADRWILSRTQRLIQRATEYLLGYDYAAAKSEAESFLWGELADNYLEMCKTRLYGSTGPAREAACYTVHQVLLALIKLFAPFLPHVTEEIYQGLFAVREGLPSIHIAHWPAPDVSLEDAAMEEIGAVLVGIATDVRRYKSEHSLPLGTELALLQLATNEQALLDALQDAEADLMSVTRARRVQIVRQLDSELEAVSTESSVAVAVSR